MSKFNLTARVQNKVIFNQLGNVSLIASDSGKLTNFQLESIKRSLRRDLKKKVRFFIQVFPQFPITKKPNDTRLGRGKANVKYWASKFTKGTILLELQTSNANVQSIKNTLYTLQAKLPIKTYLFSKQTRWIL